MLYNIELGDVSNLKEISVLNNKVFKEVVEEEHMSYEEYKDVVDKKKSLILLVKINGRIVANSVAVERNKNYHIMVIVVMRGFQKRGIGTRLLEYNEKMAKKGGFSVITINAKNDSPFVKVLNRRKYKSYRVFKKDKSCDYKLEL